MKDVLKELVTATRERIKSGFYRLSGTANPESEGFSFVDAIRKDKEVPVVTEIKPASPSEGQLITEETNVAELAELYRRAGAAGFSVLTDPDYFGGALGNLAVVSELGLPTLMKDFVLDYGQIGAGNEMGADAVLLIYRLFERNMTEFKLEEAVAYAHDLGLEVLLETNDLREYEAALGTDADMIGINNRDLRSLEVDLSTTKEVLTNSSKDRPVWSMSGISGKSDLKYLNDSGGDAFLVGTALSRSENPKQLLEELMGDSDG
jgi:indole-3-glycerol phosphate synthase